MLKQTTPNSYDGDSPVVSTEASDHQNVFQSIMPTQISVTRDLSNGVGSKSGSALQHTLASLSVYQNLPGDATIGVDDFTRMKMSILSGLDDEVIWTLKKFLVYSNKAPYMISLKTNKELVRVFDKFIILTKPILKNFESPINQNDFYILQKGLNSILILRNLAQDADSTQVLATDVALKEFLLEVLIYNNEINEAKFNLYQGNTSYFIELTHYVLDLVEAISSYIAPAKKNDLYFQNLVSILRFTKDRYSVISILRSLSRLLVRSKSDQESAADNLDDSILNEIVYKLLIDCDSELIMASLDFLYQYILPGNERINRLLSNKDRYSILSTVLPNLLTYNTMLPNYESLSQVEIKLAARMKPQPPTSAPDVSEELFQQLLNLNEPMRSTAWLRCCFQAASTSEVTQISLWKSYEETFSQIVRDSGKKLLPAVEFIKNVSNAFHGASAMVITDSSTTKKRFIIKGIQPRIKALNIPEAEAAAMAPVSENENNEGLGQMKEALQVALPTLDFPNKLSDVSKASATFLCLVSNDSKGLGLPFCKGVKPTIMHKLADVSPLSEALSEYLDNVSIV